MSQIPSMPETIEILHLSPEATLPTRAHANEAEWAEIAAEVDRSIQSTVRYTALAPDRFKNFWKD